MKTVKNLSNEEVKARMEEKKAKVSAIANSEYPKNVAYHERHYYKVLSAKQYVKDLKDALDFADEIISLADDAKFVITNKHTFPKLIEKADSYNLEVDTSYCKIAEIFSFPFDSVYIVYMADINEL